MMADINVLMVITSAIGTASLETFRYFGSNGVHVIGPCWCWGVYMV